MKYGKAMVMSRDYLETGMLMGMWKKDAISKSEVYIAII